LFFLLDQASLGTIFTIIPAKRTNHQPKSGWKHKRYPTRLFSSIGVDLALEYILQNWKNDSAHHNLCNGSAQIVPSANEFTVPAISFINRELLQYSHVTKLAPMIPTQIRFIYRPLAVLTRPASAHGMAPVKTTRLGFCCGLLLVLMLLLRCSCPR
jgi:hypothetical protein